MYNGKKKNRDKIIAKVIYNTMMVVSIIAGIFLIATLGAMVESWEIRAIHAAIAIVCIIWLSLVALFIHWLDR